MNLKLFGAIVLVAGISHSAQASVTYTVTNKTAETFSVTTADFINTGFFTASQLDSCSTNDARYNCVSAEFSQYVPTADEGNFSIVTFVYGPANSGGQRNYYFPGNAFTTVGSYQFGSLDNLTVSQSNASVPEPTAWALMVVGFGAIGAAMRKRQRVTVSYA